MIAACLYWGLENFGYTVEFSFSHSTRDKETACTMLGFAVALTMVASVTSRAGAFVLPVSVAGTSASRPACQVQTA